MANELLTVQIVGGTAGLGSGVERFKPLLPNPPGAYYNPYSQQLLGGLAEALKRIEPLYRPDGVRHSFRGYGDLRPPKPPTTWDQLLAGGGAALTGGGGSVIGGAVGGAKGGALFGGLGAAIGALIPLVTYIPNKLAEIDRQNARRQASERLTAEAQREKERAQRAGFSRADSWEIGAGRAGVADAERKANAYGIISRLPRGRGPGLNTGRLREEYGSAPIDVLRDGHRLAQGFVNGIGRSKFTDSQILMREFSGAFAGMPAWLQQQGAGAMLAYARGMERNKQAPAGTTEALLRGIARRFNGLSPAIDGVVVTSLKSLDRLLNDRKLVASADKLIKSLRLKLNAKLPDILVRTVPGSVAALSAELLALKRLMNAKDSGEVGKQARLNLDRLRKAFDQALSQMARRFDLSKDAARDWADALSNAAITAGNGNIDLGVLADGVAALRRELQRSARAADALRSAIDKIEPPKVPTLREAPVSNPSPAATRAPAATSNQAPAPPPPQTSQNPARKTPPKAQKPPGKYPNGGNHHERPPSGEYGKPVKPNKKGPFKAPTPGQPRGPEQYTLASHQGAPPHPLSGGLTTEALGSRPPAQHRARPKPMPRSPKSRSPASKWVIEASRKTTPQARARDAAALTKARTRIGTQASKRRTQLSSLTDRVQSELGRAASGPDSIASRTASIGIATRGQTSANQLAAKIQKDIDTQTAKLAKRKNLKPGEMDLALKPLQDQLKAARMASQEFGASLGDMATQLERDRPKLEAEARNEQFDLRDAEAALTPDTADDVQALKDRRQQQDADLATAKATGDVQWQIEILRSMKATEDGIKSIDTAQQERDARDQQLTELMGQMVENQQRIINGSAISRDTMAAAVGAAAGGWIGQSVTRGSATPAYAGNGVNL